MSNFAERIIVWQQQHGRHNLPWQDAGAYGIWLSEIMLQQTQVSTVIPYYLRFMATFPDIGSLANASEERVLALWSGLGYYARGRNLHRAAKIIADQYQGVFPRLYEQILELPGIGRSTAAAICALAYFERRAILDGNVKRVLSRYCGFSGWSGEYLNLLWLQAEALLPNHDIACYTQALMDMGATLCKRSKPACSACPVQQSCHAFLTGRIAELPTPRPRKSIPVKDCHFLLLLHGDDILLEKRPEMGIWGGLWCMPQFDDMQALESWCAGLDMGSHLDKHGKSCFKQYPSFIHTFTHFKWDITPVIRLVNRKPKPTQKTEHIWMNILDAEKSAIPTPVRKLLQHLN